MFQCLMFDCCKKGKVVLNVENYDWQNIFLIMIVSG